MMMFPYALFDGYVHDSLWRLWARPINQAHVRGHSAEALRVIERFYLW